MSDRSKGAVNPKIIGINRCFNGFVTCMNITVYEKPTCTTCRKLNKLFEENGIDWKKVNYFIEPLLRKNLLICSRRLE